MGNSAGREMMNPTAVNTPMLGLCVFSGLFNSIDRGRLRIGNAYTNIALLMIFGLSTGFSDVLHQPIRGAQLGIVGSCIFLAGRPMRALYTNRFLSPHVHNAVGSFYLVYHSVTWYRAAYEFEDAREGGEDEEHF